jgi:RNA polymerase sigma-70 factor (ECF subfamily)
MPDSPATSASLLVRLRDRGDGPAWRQFGDVYGPLIYGFARKYGLQDADANDVTQDVLRLVAGAIGALEYDPDRGSFRGWLFTVARNQLRKFLGRRRPGEQGSGDSGVQLVLESQPASEDELTSWWDVEFQQNLFNYAAGQVRGDFQEATWQAFWKTGVEGRSAKDVAQELQLTVAAVYLAKSRVMARLREHIQQLRGD